jgi:uncharacterized protein YprB with RNaseH-like and TPR domain
MIITEEQIQFERDNLVETIEKLGTNRIAEIVNCWPSYISQVKYGQRPPSDKMLAALAGARADWWDGENVPRGNENPRGKITKNTMRVEVEELLGMRPSVNLDFATFDLETSNLEADFSIILCAAIKPYGLPPIVFRADEYVTWYKNRANDYQIVEDISNELRRHAIIVTHYGERFDIPFLRAKMVRHGLSPLPPMFGIDSWRIAKQNFQVSSRRLKALARFFDIGEKTQVDGTIWLEAAYNGDKEAMDYIVEHNIRDVEVLEKLACITFPYLKSIPKL